MTYALKAVIGLVGVPTRDHRVLLPPAEGALLARPCPLPLLGGVLDYTNPSSEQSVLGIGRIDDVRVEGEQVVATGLLDDCSDARDYVGALRLKAAGVVLDAADGTGQQETDGGQTYEVISGWRVMGATIVRRPAWDLPPVELREVEPVTSGLGTGGTAPAS